MINSTFGGFMTARQGMAASQHGLNLTGHNLTNSATEGYTRQRIDQVSLNFNGTYRYASQYNVNVGNGVLVTGTSQLRDPFLDLRYRNEVAHVGEQGIKLEVLGDLQSILDEVKNAGDDTLGDGGIFNQLGDVLAKLQQLSNEVGNKEFDNMVKSSCQSLVTLFQSYDKRIQEVEDNLAYDLENVDVPRVNEILKSISELNKTIKSNEIMGDSALELKDQRNLLIDELSNYMKINVLYKPVQVSASTVVDELTISMVGSDGNKYALVADEQYRQLELGDMCNVCANTPGEYNIGLSALTPVDAELKSNLNTALYQLNQAIAANNPQTQIDNLQKTGDAFKDAKTKYDELYQAVYGVKDHPTKPDAPGAEKLYKDAEAAKQKAFEDWSAAAKALADYKANLPADQAPDEAEVTKLQAAIDAAAKEYDTKTKELPPIRAEYTNAMNALTAYEKSTYAPAEKAYKEAIEAMPSSQTEFADLYGAWMPDPTDNTKQVVDPSKLPVNWMSGNVLTQGGGGAATALKEAQDKYDSVLNALSIAEEAGKAVDSINTLLVDGSLKGSLEMLNYSAEFDNPPNTIRGIGYFKNMLDTLAYEFATKMNEANNPAGVVQKNGNSEPIYRLDKDGNPIQKKDADGNFVFETDADGNQIKDENGQPIPVYETSYNLFGSTDGQKIDAGNICLAEGWVKNEYSITPSMKVDASSGSNDNILHMISLFGEKFSFKASEDLINKISFNTTPGAQDSMGDTLTGMKPGDSITIDGKTFTYVKGATGANGTEFDVADFETLKNAGEKQGLTISRDANNKITATTTDLDLKNVITVQGKQVTDLADIKLENLTYGDTITINGKTFTYKPDAATEVTAQGGVQDKTDGVFKNFASLKTEAAAKNITIGGTALKNEQGKDMIDANGNPVYKIDSVTQTPNLVISAADITVDKADNFHDLQYGDTIVINNGINPPVKLTYTEPPAPNTTLTADDIKAGKFSSMDELMQAAKAQGIDMYVDTTTGEITSASAIGSNLFNGTFEEYFTNIGSVLGLDIKATTELLDNYSQLASTIAQNREAVTGVSLDEEAMNIMRYQQSYNASARLMTALDEMLNTLITNTGVVGR